MSWRSTSRPTTPDGPETSEWPPRRLARVAPSPRDEPSLQAARAPLRRLLVREEDRIVVVRLADVDWIEGEGNYVRLHEGSESHRHRATLAGLGARLDPHRFARIHRSTWVNVDRVREIRSTESGGHDVILRDGVALSLSRGYRRRFLEQLES